MYIQTVDIRRTFFTPLQLCDSYELIVRRLGGAVVSTVSWVKSQYDSVFCQFEVWLIEDSNFSVGVKLLCWPCVGPVL